jgi:hypothetical protein
MLKHFKTKIMAFKLTKDFKSYITNIMSNNLKDQIKREGGVLIELHHLIKV